MIVWTGVQVGGGQSRCSFVLFANHTTGDKRHLGGEDVGLFILRSTGHLLVTVFCRYVNRWFSCIVNQLIQLNTFS